MPTASYTVNFADGDLALIASGVARAFSGDADSATSCAINQGATVHTQTGRPVTAAVMLDGNLAASYSWPVGGTGESVEAPVEAEVAPEDPEGENPEGEGDADPSATDGAPATEDEAPKPKAVVKRATAKPKATAAPKEEAAAAE